ncbi:hypothetical protein DPV73_00770 [Leptospira mayottensis]|nr:hypothetical protein DPV73_00770 [Leptospira mayottensis]
MGSYILGLQDDFVRSLEFVTLFEFVNELKQSAQEWSPFFGLEKPQDKKKLKRKEKYRCVGLILCTKK